MFFGTGFKLKEWELGYSRLGLIQLIWSQIKVASARELERDE